MKDIRDLIKIADVYGTEAKEKAKQIDEGLGDWIADFFGLEIDPGDKEKINQSGKDAGVNDEALKKEVPKLTQDQKDAIAGRGKYAPQDQEDDEGDDTVDTTNAPVDDNGDDDESIVGDDPVADTTAVDNQAQADAAQNQQDASYADDAQATDPAASSGGSLLGRKLDTTTPNLMKAYNDGGKKAMPAINNLQTALSRLGFDPKGIDGKYGNGTYAAVQAFQKANGLKVDGQAGPNTMAALKKALDDKFEKNKVSPDSAADDEAQRKADDAIDNKMDSDNTARQSDAEKQADDNMGFGNDPQGEFGGTPTTQDQDGGVSQGIESADIQTKIDRFNELLRKAQEEVQSGAPNAELDGQQRGVMTASVDFRHLMNIVEGVLTEALTAEEQKELQALYQELQGEVGKDPNLDKAIEDALNAYLQAQQQGKIQNASAQAPADDEAQRKADDAVDNKMDKDNAAKQPAVTLDGLAAQIKPGLKFSQFEKIVKDAEALEPEDAAQDANLLQKLGRKAQQLISTADYRSRYVIANGAQNLQIDGLYRPDGSSFIFMQNGEPAGARGGNTKQAMQVAQMGLLPPKKLEDFKKLAAKDPKFQSIIAAHEKATGTVGNDAEEKVMAQDVTPSVEYRIQSNGSRINSNIAGARGMPYVDTIENGKRTRTYGDKAALAKKFPGKQIGGLKAQPTAPAKTSQAPADANVAVQMASKEYDMTKKLDEASMNISMNGADAREIADLVAIIKNAGMDATHIDMPMSHDAMHTDIDSHKIGPAPCPTCGSDHGDSPCGMGEEVVDEWENTPDGSRGEEEYADHNYMVKDLSGGINRSKKMYKASQRGDNAMAVESIKSKLHKALEEAYKNKK